jgi:hypothetical protein
MISRSECMKKKLILIWLLCVATAWCALAAPPPSFKHLPHYMKHNQCDPFSKEAVRMLHKRGIPAHRITYGWSQFGGARDFHAAVLFQWEGKFYFMDNARMGPRPVAGKTDLGCVNRITPDWQTMCWMVNEENERVAPRKMADLFAPAPEWMKQLQESNK